MNAVFAVFLIGLAVGAGIFFARGYISILAEQALDLAKAGQYERARAHILRAVRLRPALRRNAQLSSLYEAVISNNPSASALAAEYPTSASAKDQDPQIDQFYKLPIFRTLLIVFIVTLVLIQLANI